MNSRQDIIENIITLQDYFLEENPNKKLITRDFFRDNSDFSESEWRKLFGKFSQLLSEAGLIESTQEKKFYNSVAKHSDKNILEKLNKERQNWGLDYLRDYSKRFQTIITFSDVHDINADPFFVRCLFDTVKRVKPEYIVGNGDIYDLTEFGKYSVDPREYDPVKRLNWVYGFFASLRQNSPESCIVLIEGNHEYRLIRHLAEKSPVMKDILADFHRMDVRKFFKLDDLEVDYFGKANMTTFTERDIKNEINKNYMIFNNQILFHHFPQGKNYGYPGVNGHHHKHLSTTYHSPQFGSFEWHQMGGGHKRNNEYQITMGEQWSVGFMLCHLDTFTKRCQFEYIDLSQAHCFIGGQLYIRNEEELKFLI